MPQIEAQIINKLYESTIGMNISLSERERLGIADSSFTYGEINPDTFVDMLKVVNPQPGEVFYDLGSGAGKAVYMAAMLNDWRRCCGVEVLEGLYAAALALHPTFISLPAVQQQFPDKAFNIEFINQDFLTVDFSDANVVFLHATTFGPLIWEPLMEKMNALQSGTRAIVNTKRLNEDYYELISEVQWEMGWGDSTVFTYRRK